MLALPPVGPHASHECLRPLETRLADAPGQVAFAFMSLIMSGLACAAVADRMAPRLSLSGGKLANEPQADRRRWREEGAGGAVAAGAVGDAGYGACRRRRPPLRLARHRRPRSRRRPIFLFSDLSDHTKNLAADARASLLVEEASRHANPQTAPRVTLVGRIARDDEPRLRRRFLARHPGAAFYAGFADFHVFRMTIERVHYVGGFGRARWLAAADVLADRAAADALAACEDDVLARLNAEHADAVQLIATRLLGRRGTGWRIIGVDPAGVDFRRGASLARLAFPRPATDAESLVTLLLEQADEARRGPAPSPT